MLNETGNTTVLVHPFSLRSSFKIIELQVDLVKQPFIVIAWLLAVCFVKFVFKTIPKLSKLLPESATLIIVGVVLGLILKFAGVDESHFRLDTFAFFYVMLPPIVFEAGFNMPAKAFFNNFPTILCFAVLGTVINAMIIGFTLFGICKAFNYVEFSLLHCLLYGSLVSATDPVAVISVLEEINVNELLFVLVFSESLFNDAVTVVLYNLLITFVEINVTGSISNRDVIFGVISFFVVGMGGSLVGILYGLVASVISRYTYVIPAIEMIIVLIFGYAAYITADLFRLSSISAAVFCGITIRRYVTRNFHSQSPKLPSILEYNVKMVALCAEAVVFLFLGLTAVSDLRQFNPVFFFTSLIACILYRPILISSQTFFVNLRRTRKLTWKDQVVLSYAGLRGPIAYGLCAIIDENVIPGKGVFASSCMGVIFFTVFLQGGTIRVLLDKLKVERNEPALCVPMPIGDELSEKPDIDKSAKTVQAKSHWARFERLILNKIVLREAARPNKTATQLRLSYQTVPPNEKLPNET